MDSQKMEKNLPRFCRRWRKKGILRPRRRLRVRPAGAARGLRRVRLPSARGAERGGKARCRRARAEDERAAARTALRGARLRAAIKSRERRVPDDLRMGLHLQRARRPSRRCRRCARCSITRSRHGWGGTSSSARRCTLTTGRCRMRAAGRGPRRSRRKRPSRGRGWWGRKLSLTKPARSPCYHYFDKMRREHVVWFEDARSLRAKIALAAEKGLQGIGFWQAGRELAQAWPLLDALLTLEPSKKCKKPPNGRQRLTKRVKFCKITSGAAQRQAVSHVPRKGVTKCELRFISSSLL